MAYCGCGTKANKGRWGLVCILLILAVIFLGINIGLSSQCRVCTIDSNGNETCDDDFGTDPGRDWGDVEGCSEGGVVATSFLFLICLIAATIPCCCMCCCAHPPQASQYQHDMAIIGKPNDAAGGTYQQDVYGQPAYSQPEYSQPAYAQPGQANGQQNAVI